MRKRLAALAARGWNGLCAAKRAMLFGLALTATAPVLSASADIARGLVWLQAQVQPNGSLGTQSPVAAAQQARCETASTLSRLAGSNLQVAALVASLQEYVTDAATETLACWQQLRQQLGQTIAGADLELRRVAQQGYAAYLGFNQSNALDSGWGLAAQLQNLGAQDKSTLLGWLQSTQHAEGSFIVAGKADLMATALILRTLKEEASRSTVAAAVSSKAAVWLLAQRNAQRNWHGDVASTALVYEAVHPYTGAEPAIGGGVDAYLLGQQQPDGSWQGDPYVTAVALRALALTAVTPVDPTRAGLKVAFVDARIATAVPGVRLESINPVVSAIANSAGQMQLAGLQPGDYQFAASLSGYATAAISVNLAAGQTLDLGVIQLLPPNSSSAAVISGTVRERGSNQAMPLATVTVEGQGRSALSGSDGSYLITNVVPGAVTLSATRPGFIAATSQATAQAGQVLHFSPSLSPDPGTLGSTDCKIGGTVLEAATQQPLGGVGITLSGANNLSLTTDAAGRYSSPNLVAGSVTVRASKGGYDTVSSTTQLTCSILRPTVLDFSPRLYPANQTPPNGNTAGLSGVVMDAGTNQPVAGTQVQVTPAFGSPKSALTGSDGAFSVTGLDGATASISVQATDYDGVTLQFSISPLTITDLAQVRLRRKKVLQLLPDLVVASVARATELTDPQTLVLSGSVEVKLVNAGTQTAPGNVPLIAFSDINRNSAFDPATDLLLGQVSISDSIAPQQTLTLQLSVSGILPFRDAPIYVMADPYNQIAEVSETNNLRSTAQDSLIAILSQPFMPKFKWHWTNETSHPGYNQVMMAPVVGPYFDTNGDGVVNQLDDTLVAFIAFSGGAYFGSSTGVVRLLDGKTGLEAGAIFEGASGPAATSGLALADLDNNGFPELIAVDPQFRVVAYEKGVRKWRSPVVAGTFLVGGVTPTPQVADLDGDGQPEVIVGRTVLNANGTFKWIGSGKNVGAGGSGGPNAGGCLCGANSIASDLFGTGKQNLIAGASVYTAEGQLLWEDRDGFAAVADFERSGLPSIVTVAYDTVSMYSREGQLKWRVSLPGGVGPSPSYSGGPPTVADADGDGIPDIGVASGTRYTVFRADGSVLWSSVVEDTSSRYTGSTFFDFDGDGTTEILYADERTMRVFAGKTGQVLWSTPNPSGTLQEYPVVADIDRDGSADFVVVANNYQYPGVRGVRAYEDTNTAWMPTRSIWNQHAYSVNNINDDLSVPRNPVPSWQTHNTFRLNQRIDGAGRAIADMTVGYVRVADGGSSGSTLTVRAGNGGSYKVPVGIKLAVYSSNPALGTPTASSLVGTATVPFELQSGEWRDVAISLTRNLASLNALGQIWIVGDDDGTGKHAIADFDRGNNTVAGGLPLFTANLAPTVTTDRLAYTEADQALFTAVARNLGSLAQDAYLRFTVFDAAGRVADMLPVGVTASLPASGSVSFAGLWPVSGVLGGSYQVRADLYAPTGLLYGSASAGFSVMASQAKAASTRIVVDRVSYSAAQTVQLASRAVNNTSNTALDDLRARTVVTSSSGQQIFGQTEAIAQLASGGQRQYSYSLTASGLAAGNYNANLQLLNAQGATLSQSTTSFTVLGTEQTGVGLAGQLQAPPTAVIGAPVALELSASNNGNAALADVPVNVRVIDPSSGTLLASFTQTLGSWPQGANQALTWNWTAQGLDGQTVVAAASAQIAGRDVALGQANIRLIGVPKLDAQPAQLAYPLTYVGETKPSQVVTLTSVGTATATAVTLALSGSDPSQIVIPQGGCTGQASLPIGATCTFAVNYQPTLIGQHSASLQVGYTDGTELTIALTGHARPVVLGGTATPDAPQVTLGRSIGLSYTLSNPANASVTATVTLSLIDSSGQPETTWPIQASLTPSGTLSGTQSFTATGIPRTLTVVLSQSVAGVATVLAQSPLEVIGIPKLEAQPVLLTYPTVYVGETAPLQTVTLTSSGSITATAVIVSLAGTHPSQFVIPPGTCTQQTSLGMGASCTFAVSYRPSDTGVHSAQARISFAGGADILIQLSGQAIPIVLAGGVAPEPAQVHIGEPTSLAWSVSNPAGVSMNATLSLSLLDAAGQSVAAWPIQASIGAGATTAGNQGYIPEITPQTLKVVLSQSVGGASTVLATATLVVTEIPVKVDPQAGIRRHSRILVLVSCPQGQGQQGNAPPDDANCVQQRSLAIAGYLTSLGIANKVVSTQEDFKRELCCGTYNTYWISGGAAKLSPELVGQLREAIWTGEGLITDGVHDARNQLLHPANGIVHRGKLPTSGQNAAIPEGSIYAPGSLPTLGQPFAPELLPGAQAQAWFTQIPGNQVPVPAIVSNRHGQGNSVLFAFDLAAMVSADPQASNSPLRGVMTATASHNANGTQSLTIGDLMALAMGVVNQGTRTTAVEIRASLPIGLQHHGTNIEPSAVQQPGAGAGSVTWTLGLGPLQTRELLWQVLAKQAGVFELPVAFYSVPHSPGEQARLLESRSFSLTVQPPTHLLQEAPAQVQALQPDAANDKTHKTKALNAAVQAASLHGQGRYQEAIGQWLAAADALITIVSANTMAARDAVAKALEASTDALCAAAP